MKKFYLLLLSLLVGVTTSLAANPVLYLRGAISGSDWPAVEKYKFTENNGVYTLKVDQLSGEFKIADATWSSSDNYGAGSVSKLAFDTDYTLVNGSNGNLSLAAGAAENCTLTFTYSTKTLRITGAQGEVEVTYSLNGQFTNASWGLTPLVENAEGKWCATLSPVVAAGSFGVRQDTNGNQSAYYKGGDTLTEENPSVTLDANASADSKYSLTAGREYTFTFDPETLNLSITFDGGVVEPTYPDNLYLFGQVNGQGWAPNNYLPFTTGEDGVYTIKNAEIGDAGAGLGYFSFATGYGASEDVSEWSKLGVRYGATEDGTAAVVGQTMTIQPGENSFSIASNMAYDMTVNLKENTLVVTESVVTPPEPAKFGIVGSVNEWSISAPLEMTANENVYTYTFDELPEGAEFKIAKMGEYATDAAAWDATYGAEGPEGDTTAPAVDVTVGTEMNAWLKSSNNFKIAKKLTDVTVTFTFVDTPDTASTLLVEGTEEQENPVQDFTAMFNFTDDCGFPESDFTADGTTGNSYVNITDHQFVVDNVTLVVNGGGTAPRLYKTKAGLYDIRFYKPASGSTDAGKMTITAPEGYYIASVALNSVGAPSASNYSSLSYGDDFEANSDYTTAEGMKSSLQVVSKADKKPASIVISGSTKTVRVSTVDVEVKNVASGVEEIISDSNENAPVEYYNLNGIRVNNPENGLFIRRQGSKVEKVIIR